MLKAFQFNSAFDAQPNLEGHGITANPLREEDRSDLFAAASDPNIWQGHPAKTRYKPEVFHPYFDFLLATKGNLIFRETPSGEAIGCSNYYCDPNAPTRLSIGFTFLVCEHWGGQTNHAIKSLMLDHLFTYRSEAWFHIAPTNIRSQRATQKLGAVYTHMADLNLSGQPAAWQCYCLTLEAYERTFKV
ncbi:MAG: GNAT family N-acetyltransferase [Pseudomonadota bacterium]